MEGSCSGAARAGRKVSPHWLLRVAGQCAEEPHSTWAALLKLLFLIVINNNVCLHRDQLLLVKLPEVQECQLIKLLIAEQHLCQQRDSNIVWDITTFSPSQGSSVPNSRNITRETHRFNPTVPIRA